jgi:hypothetical protein
MAKSKGFIVDSRFFLQLSIGAFFLVLGIMGFGEYNSVLNKFARTFGRNDTLRIVVAVVEVVMGGLLIAGLFVSISGLAAKVLFLACFAAWAGIILYFNVFGTKIDKNFLPWCYEISWRCSVLAGLWIVGKKYL